MYAGQLRWSLGRLILCTFLPATLVAQPAGGGQVADSAEGVASRQPPPLLLEDVPEDFRPERPATEAQRDQLEAVSLFAAARMYQHRNEFGEALRLYQRALRRDPRSSAIGRAIIPLAFQLKRQAEGVRYALKTVEMEDADPLLLERLGAYLIEYLIEQGDWQRATRLYERVHAAQTNVRETVEDLSLQIAMGRLYHLTDDYAKAADCFARVLYAVEHPQEFELNEQRTKALLGKSGPSLRFFGGCFLRADRPQEATAAFEKAHQVAPNRGLLEFDRARVHLHRRQPEKALAALKACFRENLDEEGIAPYELLADVLDDLGQADQLVERLQEICRAEPKNVPAAYSLASVYRDAGQYDQAEPLLMKLMEQAPTLTGYRSLAEIYRRSDRREKLLRILGDAVEKTGMLEALGEQAETVSGDADLMAALVKTARQIHQDDPAGPDYGVRLAVALLALRARQYEAAAEFFDLAMQLQPDRATELLLLWGMELLLSQRPADAAKVFQRAVEEHSSPQPNPAFHYHLAAALAMDDRTDEALAAARQAAELKADSPQYLARVAWVLYRGKRNEAARKAYLDLIERFDDDHRSADTREVLRDARLMLSNLLVEEGDLPQAEEWLEQVLDEFPDDPGASNDLGYLWADQHKHLQRSLRMIRLAVEAQAENVAYRDSLGWVLRRLGRHQEAVAELERAAAGDEPPDPVILDHLGDAYQAAELPQKAKDAWQRSAEAFRKAEQPEKATQTEKKLKAALPANDNPTDSGN